MQHPGRNPSASATPPQSSTRRNSAIKKCHNPTASRPGVIVVRRGGESREMFESLILHDSMVQKKLAGLIRRSIPAAAKMSIAAEAGSGTGSGENEIESKMPYGFSLPDTYPPTPIRNSALSPAQAEMSPPYTKSPVPDCDSEPAEHSGHPSAEAAAMVESGLRRSSNLSR